MCGLSERRACELAGQPRSTQRYEPALRVDEEAVRQRLHDLAEDHPRRGYRHRADLMRREGTEISDGRAWRLSRRENLQVSRKQRRRRRLGDSSASTDRLAALYPGHVWSYDFKFDTTVDTRPFKILTVMDEFTRRALRTHVARSIKGRDVIDQLAPLITRYGAPAFVRSDNGPEFTAREVCRWLAEQGAATAFIEPGAPWQNAYIESYHSRLCLDRKGGACQHSTCGTHSV